MEVEILMYKTIIATAFEYRRPAATTHILLLHIHIIIGKFSSLSKKMNSEAASGTIFLVFVKPFSLFAPLPNFFFFLVQDVAYLETVGCWENVLRKFRKNRSWKKLVNLITHRVHVYILRCIYCTAVGWIQKYYSST